MSLKNIINEKDIEIITLSDSNLKIFYPPSNISRTKSFFPSSPNKSKDSKSPDRVNFYYSSKDEYLGVGGFSKVYKFRGDLENKAVKKILVDPTYYSKKLTAVDSIKREIYGMTKAQCDNSLKQYGVYQNSSKNMFFIIMEQCEGNMDKYVKDRGQYLNVYEILLLLNQLNNAFYLLDKNNIIHRDIKPSNILYKNDPEINIYHNKKIFCGKKLIFKLGDYGVCLPLYENTFSKSQFMGTLDFMAPEIYKMRTEKEHPVYTKKIDLFSLGQSILCMMGYIHKATSLNEEKIKDIKNRCNLFNGNKKERLLADLIFNHLLIYKPEKRDNWEQYFNHPIFKQKISYNYFSKNKSIDIGNMRKIKKLELDDNLDINKRRNKSFNKKKLSYIINKENNKKLNIEKDINVNNHLKLNLDIKNRNKSHSHFLTLRKINDNNEISILDTNKLNNKNIHILTKNNSFDNKNKNIHKNNIDKDKDIIISKSPIFKKKKLNLNSIYEIEKNNDNDNNDNNILNINLFLTKNNNNNNNNIQNNINSIIEQKQTNINNEKIEQIPQVPQVQQVPQIQPIQQIHGLKNPKWILAIENSINFSILNINKKPKDIPPNYNKIYTCNTLFKINNASVAEIEDTNFNNNSTRNVRYFNNKRRGKKKLENNNEKKNISFYLSKNTRTKINK